MATTHSLTISDTLAPSPSASALARWPVYGTVVDAVDGATYTGKESLLLDLFNAIGGHQSTISDIIQRISNTDTNSWADRGSRAR